MSEIIMDYEFAQDHKQQLLRDLAQEHMLQKMKSTYLNKRTDPLQKNLHSLIGSIILRKIPQH